MTPPPTTESRSNRNGSLTSRDVAIPLAILLVGLILALLAWILEPRDLAVVTPEPDGARSPIIPGIIALLGVAGAGAWHWRIRVERNLEATVVERTALITSLLECLPDPVFYKDRQGVYLGCNPAFATLVGKDIQTIPGCRAEDLAPSHLAAAARDEDLCVLERGELNHFQVWFTLPDGQKRLLETRKAPLRSTDGQILGLVGIVRDLTELSQTAERLGLVIAAVEDGIWDWDTVTNRVFFSSRWKSMLGYADHEVGNTLEEWSSRVHPDDLPGVLKDIREHQEGLTPHYRTEHRMRCKDGSWRWILDRGRVVTRDGEGKILRMVGTHTDITAQREAAEALAAARRFQDQLIAASPLGITVYDGASGACLQTNHAASRTIGATEAQILAQDFRKIHSWQEHGLVTTAEITLADGAARSGECHLISTFGKELWLSYHFSRIDDVVRPRLLLMYEDITLRKALEQERRDLQRDLENRVHERTLDLVLANQELAARDQNLRIFQTAIEQNPLGILITGPDRRITYANPAYHSQTGWPAVAVLGTDPLLFLIPEENGGIADALAQGQAWSGELRYRHRNGHAFWINALITPLTGSDGTFLGHVGFQRDITAIRQAQAEARQRSEELIQADKLAALGTLVAGVGHEINNPAHFISLNAPLLRSLWLAALPILDRQAQEDPDLTLEEMPWPRARALVPRLFDGIEEGIVRIRRIVADLRDFAQPDPGGIQPVDLNRVVQAACAITNHAIDRATRRFACTLAQDLPLVAGSFQKLEQVVVNLLLNACQALPTDDRELTVTTAVTKTDGRVTITVQDGGMGMPPEVLRRLGEPFFTTKRDRGGTGLGISVSRRIANDHGGDLRFASEPGKGTTAVLILPPLFPVGESPIPGLTPTPTK